MTHRHRNRRRVPRRAWTAALAAVMLAAALGAGYWIWRNRGLPGEGVAVPEYVTADFLPVNPYSRPASPLEEINGIVLHYVGNPATTAKANRDYFATLALGRDGTYASSHFIVGLEGEVIQCIPLTEVAYASKHRNGDTIAIEVCHPDEGGEYSPVTYATAVELTAWLCRTFDLEPEEDVIRHYDVTGKECPLYYVKNPEAWEAFRVAVKAEMERQAQA